MRIFLYNRLTYAKQAVINFLNNTSPQDWLYVTGFDHTFSEIGNVSQVGDDAMLWVNTLQPTGDTPIYSTMQTAWDVLNTRKTSNDNNDINWNYGIVALTDGAASANDADNYYEWFNSPYNYKFLNKAKKLKYYHMTSKSECMGAWVSHACSRIPRDT